MQNSGPIIRAGLGRNDGHGGLGVGLLEVNTFLNKNLEVGASILWAKDKVTYLDVSEYDSDLHTYDLNADLFGVTTYLNIYCSIKLRLWCGNEYESGQNGFYILAGPGLGLFSYNGEKKSASDNKLGTPLPGGGSKVKNDDSALGMSLNFGLGYSFGSNFDIRAETTVYLFLGTMTYDRLGMLTYTVTVGYRF